MNELTGKWNKKYAEQCCEDQFACEVLSLNLHLLPAQGVALDYACGLGANALLLAKHKLTTHAWDISTVALDKLNQFAQSQGASVSTRVCDLESQPPEPDSFDVVVVSNYLHRPSFPQLKESLRKQAVLFYQTFIVDKDSTIGPSNPDFLLRSNELLQLCSGLKILVYREEGLQGNVQQGFRNQAMVVAKRII